MSTAQTEIAARLATYAVMLGTYGTTPAEQIAAARLNHLYTAFTRLHRDCPEITANVSGITQRSADFARIAMEKYASESTEKSI